MANEDKLRRAGTSYVREGGFLSQDYVPLIANAEQELFRLIDKELTDANLEW